MSTNMNTSSSFNEEVLELLAGYAVGDLDAGEHRQLEDFVAGSGEVDALADEAAQLELVAAAIEIAEFDAMSANETSLPGGLRDKVMMQAGVHFGTPDNETAEPTPDPVLESQPPSNASASRPAENAQTGIKARELFAWIAAAAAIVLLVSGVDLFPSPAEPDPTPIVKAPTLQEQLDTFIAESPEDMIRLDWTAAADTDVTGEVVWSDQLQKGFMIFEDLDVNDPLESQYQLWIFEDPAEVAPNDGGVFDIEQVAGKTIVPFSPPYRVDSAAMFAITVEDPNGVYHSQREVIATVAVVEIPE